MKKDIPELVVEDIAVAIVKEEDENKEVVWNTYLISLKENVIESVIVTSTGYGQVNGEEVKTSTLRHFLNEVEPLSYVKIEPLLKDVFVLTNEYWLSFFENGNMFDKKYIFLPGTIDEQNFVMIPFLKKRGVMIR